MVPHYSIKHQKALFISWFIPRLIFSKCVLDQRKSSRAEKNVTNQPLFRSGAYAIYIDLHELQDSS